ncbi:MAG: hypothetical protein ACRD8A_06475 [Candidatus Acidiferrales bacterium]
MMNRREFSKLVVASGAAGILPESGRPLPLSPASKEKEGQISGQFEKNQKYDLLIKGGTVIDPSQRLHAIRDVAVIGHRIAEVATDIPESHALRIVSAKDRIVTPGFIDVEVHCNDGLSSLAVNGDHYGFSRGATTIVDNGAEGYLGIEGFIRYISQPSITRIFTSVNIFPPGVIDPTLMKGVDNTAAMDPVAAAAAAERNKPTVVGIKAYIERGHVGSNDLECLRRAVTAANASRLPVVADINDTYHPLPEVLKLLRKGDIFTHVYNTYPNGVLDANGRVLSAVLEARDRGVHFDTGQGGDKFNFDVYEKCMEQGLLPDSISTDLYSGNVDTMVYDLPTTVSKFLTLGMSLDDAIERVTSKPAQMLDFGVQIGTLRPGSEADIGIFELREGKFEFAGNSPSDKRTGSLMLVSKAVVCRGRFFVNSI